MSMSCLYQYPGTDTNGRCPPSSLFSAGTGTASPAVEFLSVPRYSVSGNMVAIDRSPLPKLALILPRSHPLSKGLFPAAPQAFSAVHISSHRRAVLAGAEAHARRWLVVARFKLLLALSHAAPGRPSSKASRPSLCLCTVGSACELSSPHAHISCVQLAARSYDIAGGHHEMIVMMMISAWSR